VDLREAGRDVLAADDVMERVVDAARPQPPAAVHVGLAVLPLAGPGAAAAAPHAAATAPDAVMLACRLDLGEEHSGY
jgi:hypothetical protein